MEVKKSPKADLEGKKTTGLYREVSEQQVFNYSTENIVYNYTFHRF